jgi:hypothetical protein
MLFVVICVSTYNQCRVYSTLFPNIGVHRALTSLDPLHSHAPRLYKPSAAVQLLRWAHREKAEISVRGVCVDPRQHLIQHPLPDAMSLERRFDAHVDNLQEERSVTNAADHAHRHTVGLSCSEDVY